MSDNFIVKPGVIKQFILFGPKMEIAEIKDIIEGYKEQYKDASNVEREILINSAREVIGGMTERLDITREEKRACFDILRDFKKYIGEK